MGVGQRRATAVIMHERARPPGGLAHTPALTLAEAKACSQLAYHGVPGEISTDKRWLITEKGLFESNLTGFRAVLAKELEVREPRFVLSFAGTDMKSLADIATDIEQALSLFFFPVPQYAQASSLAESLLRVLRSRLLVTGHSLGGGLANFVSVKHGIPGAAINAAPLGAGTLMHIRMFGKGSPIHFTHYDNKGEVVSTYAPGVQLGDICYVANESNAFEAHLLQNVDPFAPMTCASK